MIDHLEERKQIIEVCRLLTTHNLVGAHGHVSLRLGGSDQMLVTPAMAPFLATPEALITVEIEGDSEAETRAAMEWPLHRAVYRARRDTKAIVRFHTATVDAVGAVVTSLPVLHGRGSYVGAVNVWKAVAPISNSERSRAVAEYLNKDAGLILRGNGAFAVGSTMEEAFVRAIYLEESAERFLLASHVGRPVAFTSGEISIRTSLAADPYGRAWDFLKAHTS